MWNIRITNLFVVLKPDTEEGDVLALLASRLDVKVTKLGERASNPREIVISIVKDFGEEPHPDDLTPDAAFEASVLAIVRDSNIFAEVMPGFGRSH